MDNLKIAKKPTIWSVSFLNRESHVQGTYGYCYFPEEILVNFYV